jgi:hypothetical protein
VRSLHRLQRLHDPLHLVLATAADGVVEVALRDLVGLDGGPCGRLLQLLEASEQLRAAALVDLPGAAGGDLARLLVELELGTSLMT